MRLFLLLFVCGVFSCSRVEPHPGEESFIEWLRARKLEEACFLDAIAAVPDWTAPEWSGGSVPEVCLGVKNLSPERYFELLLDYELVAKKSGPEAAPNRWSKMFALNRIYYEVPEWDSELGTSAVPSVAPGGFRVPSREEERGLLWPLVIGDDGEFFISCVLETKTQEKWDYRAKRNYRAGVEATHLAHRYGARK